MSTLNCTPFAITTPNFTSIEFEVLEKWKIVELPSTQWRTLGLKSAEVIDAGGTVTLTVQFAERILPAKVRNEHLGKLLDKFQQREGRKPSKKEYAILKEDVETELLPRAFIHRTDVRVTIDSTRLYVWTGSSTKCDAVVSLLINILGDAKVTPLDIKFDLRHFAKGESLIFQPGTSAVFKGDSKQTVRIKAIAAESEKVEKFVNDPSYMVTELALHHGDDTFTLTDQLVFKKINLKGDIGGDDAEASIWLAVQFMHSVLRDLAAADEEL